MQIPTDMLSDNKGLFLQYHTSDIGWGQVFVKLWSKAMWPTDSAYVLISIQIVTGVEVIIENFFAKGS